MGASLPLLATDAWSPPNCRHSLVTWRLTAFAPTRRSLERAGMARVDPKQTLAVGDSNRQIVWISDISRRRCYSAMIMLGSDNQGLEALWVRAA